MLLSLPYLHDTIKLASPKFPKPVITFLIANVFTSAINNVMTGLKGFWGYRGTLSDITKDTVFVRYSASTKLSCNIYMTYKNIIFKTSINNIVCESIIILIPLVWIQHLHPAKVSPWLLARVRMLCSWSLTFPLILWWIHQEIRSASASDSRRQLLLSTAAPP